MPQDEIEEAAHMLEKGGKTKQTIPVTRPPAYEKFGDRESYDTANPVPLESFGETVSMPLGNILVGRSGDKGWFSELCSCVSYLRTDCAVGPNVNMGLFTDRPEIWEWLRSFLTLEKMKKLVGRDWKDEFKIERVEFPGIYAVHFVIYGILGRGVSSSTLLDNRGKGFTDYIRAKHIDVPKKFLQWAWEEKDEVGVDF